jgi:phage terminase large subunit-like protein
MSAADNTAQKEMLQEIVSALNPVKFAESLGITPDKWQKDVLLATEKRIMILAARQSGKSMICAIYALWHALNNPGALVLVLSPSLRQSSLLFKTILGYYQELGRPLPADVENTRTLEFSNTSQIVSLPGLERTTRGFSGVSLLILDEAALVDDDLYYAVRPMMAVSEGKVFAIGTPHGRRGWFFQSYTESDEFRKIKITADQCPRISAEFLEQERKALGEYWFAQEYMCEFHQAATSLFRFDVVQESVKDFDELDLDLGDETGFKNYDTEPLDLTRPDLTKEIELDLD